MEKPRIQKLGEI